MGLPKVTPGTYNYGEYSNPTQVKYNASGDRALGEAFKAVGSAVGERLAENKRKRDAYAKELGKTQAEVEALRAEEVLKNEENEIKNKAFLSDTFKKEEYKRLLDPREAMKFMRKDAEGYYRLKTKFDNEIDDLLGLRKINVSEDVFKQIGIGDVAPGSEDNYAIAKQISEGDFLLNRKDGRVHLEVSLADGSKKNIMLADLAQNLEKYTDFDQKFSFANKDYQAGLAEVAKRAGKNRAPGFYTVRDASNGKMALDKEGFIDDLMSSPMLDDMVRVYGNTVLNHQGRNEQEFRRIMAEDIYGNHIELYGGDIPKVDTKSSEGSGGDSISIEMASQDAQEIVDMIRKDTVSNQDQPEGIVGYLKTIYSPQYVKRKGKTIQIFQDQIGKDENGNEITEKVVAASYDLNRKEDVARLAKDSIDSKVPYESYGKSFEKDAIRKTIEEQIDKYIESLRGERRQKNNIFSAPVYNENSNKMGPVNQEKEGKTVGILDNLNT